MSVAIGKPSVGTDSTSNAEVGPSTNMELATVKTPTEARANPEDSQSGKVIVLSLVDPSESKLEPSSQPMTSSPKKALAASENETLHHNTALADEDDTAPPLPEASSS